MIPGFSLQTNTVVKTEKTYTCKKEGCGASFSSEELAMRHWALEHSVQKVVHIGDFQPDRYYHFASEYDANLWIKYVYKARQGFPYFKWKGPGFYRVSHGTLCGSRIEHVENVIEEKRLAIQRIEDEIKVIQNKVKIDG